MPEPQYTRPGPSHPGIPGQIYSQQQPLPVPGMTVGSVDRLNVNNQSIGLDGKRNWSNGFFSCCNEAGTCMLACFCPCIVYGKNKQRLEYLTERGQPHPDHGGSCCSGDCMMHTCLNCFGVACFLQCMTRGDMRKRYGIRGNAFMDFCAAMWCTPCELSQESQELRLEEGSFGQRY
ncbi:PLAC8-domain-containing protein [Mycena floridula]|nr:PLAC8-domain-containing protein [Mycena floridula]